MTESGLHLPVLPLPFQDPLDQKNREVNPYVDRLASPELREFAASGPRLKDLQGHWLSYFATKASREMSCIGVEVGSHFGHTLVPLAQKLDSWGWVGLDITFKRVVKCAERIAKFNVNNALSIHFDGRHLSSLFSPGEIDCLLVFFPDPWSKVKKAKHRLLQRELLEKWLPLLSPKGLFWLRTDQKSYFDWVHQGLLALGMELSNPDPDIDPSNFGSCFGDRFAEAGVGYFEGIYKKS